MCGQFDDESENWLAGRRSPAFAGHLASCARCRHVLADWASIRAAASELALSQPEPPAHIWKLLEVQLRTEGIIAPAVSPMRKWSAILPRLVSRPVLSAAYVAVLLVAGALVSSEMSHRAGQEVVNTPDEQPALISENQAFQSWSDPDPEITATLRQNLTMVDNDISLCKKSVREEPQSELARDYLNDAYEQRAELLANMVERGVSLQ
jgi:hypothetical protein